MPDPSMVTDPYNETVRRLFARPVHAGDLQAGYPHRFEAEASASEAGCRVILAAAMDGEILRALRYRVFGCPHLIAAAEAACADFEGRPIEALREFSLPDVLARLAVPVEKTGRILLLEDAISALHDRLLGERSGVEIDQRTDETYGDITDRTGG